MIDWSRITVYEVDPVCQFPDVSGLYGYGRGCRCLRCFNAKAIIQNRRPREPRYIPQEEWTP